MIEQIEACVLVNPDYTRGEIEDAVYGKYRPVNHVGPFGESMLYCVASRENDKPLCLCESEEFRDLVLELLRAQDD